MVDVQPPARTSIEATVFDSERNVLRGGYSPSSGQYHFPLQIVCPYSGADDVEAVMLSTEATAWGWTVVTAPPPGYSGPVPYGFGVVELTHEKLRLVTRLRISDPAELSFGDALQLVADVVGHDEVGNEVVVWAFAKVVS